MGTSRPLPGDGVSVVTLSAAQSKRLVSAIFSSSSSFFAFCPFSFYYPFIYIENVSGRRHNHCLQCDIIDSHSNTCIGNNFCQAGI